MAQTRVKDFSAGYYLLDAEMTHYNGDHAAAPRDMMAQLARYTSPPLFRAGDEHFYADAERGIPANTIAVPDELPSDEPVLLAKEQTAVNMMLRGGEPEKP
jgi:hypothetical protein